MTALSSVAAENSSLKKGDKLDYFLVTPAEFSLWGQQAFGHTSDTGDAVVTLPASPQNQNPWTVSPAPGLCAAAHPRDLKGGAFSSAASEFSLQGNELEQSQRHP